MSPELAFYNPERETTLHVDASRLNGLGFILKQRDANTNEWWMVQAGSRFLSPAESRYAIIELECLAATWVMKKCRQFIQGLPTFNLITNHRPLVPILNEYSLDKLDNQRLLRLKLQMTRFMFVAKWVTRKQNQEADALSRSPVDHAKASDELGEGPNTFTTRSAVVGLISGSSEEQTQDSILKSIQSAAAVDPIMLELRDVIMKGFPNDKCNLSPTLRPFSKSGNNLQSTKRAIFW